MSLNVQEAPKGNSGTKSDPIEIGNYAGRVVQVIDLGLQNQRPFQGKPKPPAPEMMVTYELGTEFLKDEDGNDRMDKPRWISESFPVNHISKEKAKSTLRYKAIDPNNKAAGSFPKLVKAPCTVTVVHNKKPDGAVYVNVGGITPPMKSMNIPDLVNPPKVFLLDEPDMEVFLSLPEWLQDKIKSNLNYNGSRLQALVGDAANGGVDATETPSEDDEPAATDDMPW